MISEKEFRSLIPGCIVIVQDAFTFRYGPERATVVSWNEQGELNLRVHSRHPNGTGFAGGYNIGSIVSIEFDLALVRDHVKETAKCHRCPSCKLAAESTLNYIDTFGGK